MAYILHARASALPTHDEAVLPPSPLRRLATLAAERGDDIAYLVATSAGVEARSWSQVETTVQRAAAGLIRSGMRSDQVVLSLLPSAHPHPELDIALRAIGAVVIHVSPRTPTEDLVRELTGVDVRLVVSQAESELDRLAGLRFPSAEMLDLGDDSWTRLLALGAERLVMDPDAVHRLDRVVDPAGTVARLLPPSAALARVAPEAGADDLDDLLPRDGVTLLVGEHTDPFVHLVRDAHLASGGTLAHVATPPELPLALDALGPTALALASGASAALGDVVSNVTVPGARRLLPARVRSANAVALRAWLGAGMERVVGEELSEGVRDALRACDVEGLIARPAPLRDADLPVPPPVVIGDAADLPRRSRGEPGRDFGLRLERSLRVVEEPEESAFVLPSLPLFGGESFLDKLLLQQAAQAEQ
ncbi:AMP-binding enzyme [Nocardioides exalbidus]|uniref:AMP-binding enzyme n=1 Tax=Nocardioides exalbidus TaxID=402596 RepID=A0A1H4RNW5_9ACTN|nr:AMP-binding protein [Nocardioides exalbidus]SEC33434.1 AMP-binding enzyme [Nocardioides exalbidus]